MSSCIINWKNIEKFEKQLAITKDRTERQALFNLLEEEKVKLREIERRFADALWQSPLRRPLTRALKNNVVRSAP